eukprot:Hpha_TRINITY_DN13078_c0_g1::TRINITY_DN13078_c0_g1_i2::g.69173::m.69173
MRPKSREMQLGVVEIGKFLEAEGSGRKGEPPKPVRFLSETGQRVSVDTARGRRVELSVDGVSASAAPVELVAERAGVELRFGAVCVPLGQEADPSLIGRLRHLHDTVGAPHALGSAEALWTVVWRAERPRSELLYDTTPPAEATLLYVQKRREQLVACLFDEKGGAVREGGSSSAVEDCKKFFTSAVFSSVAGYSIRKGTPPARRMSPRAGSLHFPHFVDGREATPQQQHSAFIPAPPAPKRPATFSGVRGPLYPRGGGDSPTTLPPMPRSREAVSPRAEESRSFERVSRELRKVMQIEASEAAKDGDMGVAWAGVSRTLVNYAGAPDAKGLAEQLTSILDKAQIYATPTPHPDTKKCPWVCAALEQLLALLCRYHTELTDVCERVLSNTIAMVLARPPPNRPLRHTATEEKGKRRPSQSPRRKSGVGNEEVGNGGQPVSILKADSKEVRRAAVAPYRARPPFFEVVNRLQQKLHVKGDALEELTIAQRAKRLKVVGKVAMWWEVAYLRVVFKAWRGLKDQENIEVIKQELHDKVAAAKKDQRAMAIENAQRFRSVMKHQQQTEARLKKALEEGDSVLELRGRLFAQKKQFESLEKNIKERIFEETTKERAARKAAVEAMDGMRHALQSLLLSIDSPRDRIHRHALKDVVMLPFTETEIPLHRRLLKWAQQMISHHVRDKGGSAIPGLLDFVRGGEIAIQALWTLLAAIHPGEMDEELDFRGEDTFASAERMYKSAERLLEKSKEFGVITGAVAADLVDGATAAEGRLSFVAALFWRFCLTPNWPSEETEAELELRREEPLAPTVLIERAGKYTTDVKEWKPVAAETMEEVLRKLLRHLRSGEGASLSMEEEADKPLYTLPQDTIDLLTHYGALEAVQDLLMDNFRRLRRIYLHYAGQNGQMGVDEFWRMFVDARVPGDASTRRAVADIVEGASPSPDISDSERKMLPGEWLGACVQFATGHFENIPVTQRVAKFIAEHIVLYCSGSERGEFRQQVYHSSVQNVLVQHRPALKKIFRHYVQAKVARSQVNALVPGDDRPMLRSPTPSFKPPSNRSNRSVGDLKSDRSDSPAPRSEHSAHRLSMAAMTVRSTSRLVQSRELEREEFMLMIGEARIRDSVCTIPVVEDLFYHFGAGSSLIYHQFVELICGLAVFKYPAPHHPLSRKVDEFIRTWLVGRLQERIRL